MERYGSPEHWAKEIIGSVEEDEQEEGLIRKYKRIIQKIIDWADTYGINISQIKKLGGGFVNLVLLIETPEGESYVAKAFASDEDASTTRGAQEMIGRIAHEDESFIPEAIAWIDDTLLIAERAEGVPVRALLAESRDDPETTPGTLAAYNALGRTLASLHERTEVPIEEAAQDTDINLVRADTQKLIKHLGQHTQSGLIDMHKSQREELIGTIQSITEGGFVSLIHGDAHLDQFFRAPNKSLLTIVDYDSVHYGDPMADVARSLSSLRDWSTKMSIPESLTQEAEKQLMIGYREIRVEGEHTVESEFDQAKIIVYELRLDLIKLKHFNQVRSKIRGVLRSEETESDFYSSFHKGGEERLRQSGLSEKDFEQIHELLRIRERALVAITYLEAIELPVSSEPSTE